MERATGMRCLALLAAGAWLRKDGITVIDGGCPLMFEPTADFGHKVMRVIYRKHVPRTVGG